MGKSVTTICYKNECEKFTNELREGILGYVK